MQNLRQTANNKALRTEAMLWAKLLLSAYKNSKEEELKAAGNDIIIMDTILESKE